MVEYVGEVEETTKNIALSNWFGTDEDKSNYSSTSTYVVMSIGISNWYDVLSDKSDWVGEYLQETKSTYIRTDYHPGLFTITLLYYKVVTASNWFDSSIDKSDYIPRVISYYNVITLSNWFDSIMEKSDYTPRAIYYIMNEVMPRYRGGAKIISFTSVGGRTFISDIFNIMADSNVNSESLLPSGVANIQNIMNEYAFKVKWDLPASIPYGKRITSYNVFRYLSGHPEMLVENLSEREFVSLRPTFDYHYYITAVMDALDGERGTELLPMNDYILSNPQIIMENIEDNILEKDGIYSTHSQASPSLNSIIFSPHSRDENGVELTMVKTLEMKADGTNHTIHILPSENGTKKFGSEDNRWNITFGSEIVTDIATTKTIQIHSGR